jgi:hypothetical protein
MRVLWVLLISAVAACAAGEPNTLTDAERAAGWRLLFDGRSFAGWNDPRQRTPACDSWIIHDGALVARKDPRVLEDLTTLESFRDFELAFEWRLEAGGNSGVKYRSWDSVFLVHDRPGWDYGKPGERAALRDDQRGQTYIVAFEFQLLDDERHPDARNGLDRRTGALYGLRAPSIAAGGKAGEWRSAKLLVEGSRVEHWVDGVKVMAADLRDPDIAEKVQQRFARHPDILRRFLESAGRPTPIALQNHGDSVVEFRNVKIRPR